MMKQLKYIVVIILAISCKNNTIEKPKKPDNLIKKDKMVEILYDMSIFTAAKGVNKQIIESKGVMPETYIYNKYKIDSLQFAESNTYYAYDLKTYQGIYDLVKVKFESEKAYIDSIVVVETEERNKRNKAQRIKMDSINGKKLRENKDREIDRLNSSRLKRIDTSQRAIRQ